MCAAPSMALEKARRKSPRHFIDVPLDVIVLRSGVPENMPGRCTDLSETGVGGMVAGEVCAGQHVAVELRLPNLGVPLRARAVVRYQGRLRCGFEFLGLPASEQEMIRYWASRLSVADAQTLPRIEAVPRVDAAELVAAPSASNLSGAEPGFHTRPRIRIQRKGLQALLAAMLLVGAVGWWQWQRSWTELEVGTQTAPDRPLRVSPETMQLRIVSKIDPVYPEEARRAGEQGVAVLDTVIAPDGSVERVQPVSGDDVLEKSAAEAVRLWKFEPYQSMGRAIAVETTIAVEFRLN
ncbi:MAG: TonB family protein [Terriglobales bacterium]